MSSSGGELRAFVFAVTFIIIFSTLLISVPAGLQGPEETPETVIPVDPNVLTGFAEIQEIYPDNFTGSPPLYVYDYDDFGGRDWRAFTDDDTCILLAAKVYLWVFWFGNLDSCRFKSPSGTDRGTQLDFDEIDQDATDGTVTYSLLFDTSGDSAGSLVVYWNVTEYASVDDAWDSDEVYMIHGLGLAETATTNIAGLIISLLFLQLPDVPVMVNALIVIPIWACIIFVFWFIVKEMIPFV